MGYIMSGVLVQNSEALKLSLFYLLMYCFQLVAVFIILIGLQVKYNITNLNQLYLIRYYNRFYCYALVFIFFSFAGVPPLSGFFLKYFLFLHIYSSGFFMLAILGLISGFIMAIIYFQVVIQLLWQKGGELVTLPLEHSKKLVMIGNADMY